MCGADLKHIVNLTCYRGGGDKKDCIGSKFVLHDSKVPENIYAVGGVVGRAHPFLV